MFLSSGIAESYRGSVIHHTGCPLWVLSSVSFLDLEHEGMNSLCEMQNTVIAINNVAVIYNQIAVQAFWILKKAGSPIAIRIYNNK